MQRFIDNWSAVLTAPAPASAGQISVEADAAARLVGLGAGDHYLLTLARMAAGREEAWEIVKVTGHAAGVLTVERGYAGTTAISWQQGESISLRVTATAVQDLLSAVETLTSRVGALEAAVGQEGPFSLSFTCAPAGDGSPSYITSSAGISGVNVVINALEISWTAAEGFYFCCDTPFTRVTITAEFGSVTINPTSPGGSDGVVADGPVLQVGIPYTATLYITV